MIGNSVDRSSVLIQLESMDEDEQLIAAAKDNPEAFGSLYDKYYARIFRYIYRRTLDVQLTEESLASLDTSSNCQTGAR